MFTTIFKTLTAHSTELSFTDLRCNYDDIYEVYTDSSEITMISVTVSNHDVLIKFSNELTYDVNVAIFVNALEGQFIPVTSYNQLTDLPTLFSGDYDDLTNKPEIPQPVDIDVIPLLESGEHIADIDINDTTYALYAPTGGGGGQIYPKDSTPIVLQSDETGTWYRKYLTGNTVNDGTIMTLSENQTYINAFGLLKRNDFSYNLPSCLGNNNDWYCTTYIADSTKEIKLLAGNVLRSSTYHIYVDYFESEV